MPSTRLLIARHGNTFAPGDLVTRVGARTDLPLVESGLKQGRSIGRYLKQEDLIPDLIFTSELKRTKQMAEQIQLKIGRSIEQKPLAIFNEIDYGPDENLPEEAVIARIGEAALNAWDQDAIVPDGWKVEPGEIINNWKEFAQDLLNGQRGKIILVITSNGIARFAPYLTGNFETFRSQHALKISTGALCRFDYDPASSFWACVTWNYKPSSL